MNFKKLISISLIMFFLFLIISCSKDSPTSVTPESTTNNTWTILIHFAIDNNIDYDYENSSRIVTNYLSTLEYIKKLDNNNSINILVMLDCYGTDSKEANYTSSFTDGYYVLSGNFNNDFINRTGTWEEKNEIKSGNVEDTKDFIDFAITNYKANKYMYSIFDHGDGFNDSNTAGTYSKKTLAIAYDDNFNSNIYSSDDLTHYELEQITSYFKNKIGKKINLFYPFACLMGGVELAYEIKNNVNYILFSEESFPAESWSYEALESIIDNPNISEQELAISFCKSAKTYFNNYRTFTLSVVDLSKIDNLYNAINNISNSMIPDINSNNKANFYDSLSSISLSSYYVNYFLDLGDYMKNIYNSTSNSEIKNYANLVLESIEQAVIYKAYANFYSESPYDYSKATGLTIYHNKWFNSSNYADILYYNTLTFASNEWYTYMKALNEKGKETTINPDSYEPDSTESSANVLKVDEIQDHNFHSFSDIDYYKILLDSLKTYNLIIKSDKIIDYIYIIKKKDLDTYNYATIKDSIFIKPTSSDTNIIILKPYSYDSYGNYNIKIIEK